MRFAFFQSMSLKYCACHEKVMPGHTKCCTCHAKFLPKTEDLMLQNATPLRKSISLTNIMSPVLHLPLNMHLWRSSSKAPRLPTRLKLLQNPHVLLTVDKMQTPVRLPRKTTSEHPKVLRTLQFFGPLVSPGAWASAGERAAVATGRGRGRRQKIDV